MSKIILCADDSKTMQTVAEITFRVSDYTYVGALSVDEAMQKARAQKPAIILADAVMPGKTGYDLCEMVKGDPDLADVPVIMLCGNSAAYDSGRGAKVGVDGHLNKPWDTQVMLDKVGELIERFGSAGVAKPGPGARTVVAPPTLSPGLPVTPAVTPKPPILPKTPAATVKPDASAAANRTKTMMGMPSVTPPATPGATAPVAPAIAPPVAAPVAPPRQPALNPTPLAEPLPTPRITAKGPAVTQPMALKPSKSTAPALGDLPPPPGMSKRGGARPSGGDPVTPTLPSKYAPPAAKSAVTQPGVPEPPPPALPKAAPNSLAASQPVAPELLAARAATEPVAPMSRARAAAPAAGNVVPMARTATSRPGRPPMISGTPKKRPAFQQPAPAAGDGKRVSRKIAAATSAAASSAAMQAGLDPNGPEMKALLALSREVVERVVWEVVPDLAETIIRENLSQLTKR